MICNLLRSHFLYRCACPRSEALKTVVLSREGGMAGEVVIANEVLDGTDMIGQVLREQYCGTRQPRESLPQGAVEAFDMIGLSSELMTARC